MILQVLGLFVSTVLQNASFTLTSRARNSKSVMFHGLASVASNGVWLLVIRQIVTHLDSWVLMATYLLGSVIGSVAMHHVSMKYLETRIKK